MLDRLLRHSHILKCGSWRPSRKWNSPSPRNNHQNDEDLEKGGHELLSGIFRASSKKWPSGGHLGLGPIACTRAAAHTIVRAAVRINFHRHVTDTLGEI